MARPRIFEEKRVGINVRESTRTNLNLRSRRLSQQLGRNLTHDQMINYFLDLPDNNIPQLYIKGQDDIEQEITINCGDGCACCTNVKTSS